MKRPKKIRLRKRSTPRRQIIFTKAENPELYQQLKEFQEEIHLHLYYNAPSYIL